MAIQDVPSDWTEIRFVEAADDPLLFLVRETAPHVFEMVSVSTRSAPRCSDPEPIEDREQTLLPESFNQRKEER